MNLRKISGFIAVLFTFVTFSDTASAITLDIDFDIDIFSQYSEVVPGIRTRG